MLQITPKIISKEIIEFCNEINETQNPHYVSVKPEAGCKIDECFWNVKNKVKLDGGKAQSGWIIVEWPNVWLEAVFHAVWISPQNNPVDITPSEMGDVQRILFLPDDTLEYDYDSNCKRICTRYKPLSKDPRVDGLISRFQQIFEIEENNSTGREIDSPASEHCGKLRQQCTQIGLQLVLESQFQTTNRKLGRNEPCHCGSGKKVKQCCGRKQPI